LSYADRHELTDLRRSSWKGPRILNEGSQQKILKACVNFLTWTALKKPLRAHRGFCAITGIFRDLLENSRKQARRRRATAPLMPKVMRRLLRYCGEATQTATSGEFPALFSGPHEAPLSPRNCAWLRVGPQ
jgi:hypothetical protein